MTKKTLDEIKAKKIQEKIAKETQEVSDKVAEVLKKEGFQLQTYIHPHSDLGVITSFESRVRLVKMPIANEKKDK